ncbi:N-acetylmuramic acid 6-phosphate etherase [Microbacterium halotolerans]|uniref:N-acetylmuramic acid 6-phosphate etherase n=1 Tax=Microbacterium halotolerans TaxID=246613 RepID=UPI000E6ADE48|nr:N-acetylmuramic acid 6-phosphate etherase [Microbacterium halotolerans]
MILDEPATESADPRFANIDAMDVADLAVLMNEADQTVPLAVRDELPRISAAIEQVSERMSRGGRLLYVGAGTPGRIGVLDASEIPPTFSTHDLVVGIIAGGPRALVDAIEGAEDDEAAGAAAMDDAGVGPLDSVVGVAASGRTPFVIGAVSRARELGALSVGLSCNADVPLSASVDHAIEVVVGPEVVSGSTRLKAGTAQKLVLNMFSTIVMVRLGKTYGNLMIDVSASNDKLRERAARMVMRVAEVDHDAAVAALRAADYAVPVAILSLMRGLRVDEARQELSSAGGRLRQALTGKDRR